jgi:hypothetical protein
MIDIIRRAFVKDSKLALVFPEDPFQIGWDENLEIARVLAARIGAPRSVAREHRIPGGKHVLGTA